MFQSSPARGGGCNAANQAAADAAECAVSILTRPWGRVQRSQRIWKRARDTGFNPHPPVGAGATRATRRICARWSWCFNPHPPVGAGATRLVIVAFLTNGLFQSSPARGGGCNGSRFGGLVGSEFVSILTRPWGRVQRYLLYRRATVSAFQSSPARGGGCNAQYVKGLTAIWWVSILTRPWGRVQRGLENARERFPKRKCSSCQGVPCRALGG